MKIDNVYNEDLEDLMELYNNLIARKADLLKMRSLLQEINNDKDYYLLGVRDNNGKIVATTSAIVCKDISGDCTPFMVLENIIVRESLRNKGIGKMMITYIESIAKERNCRYIIFVSAVERIEAHKFYESLGYELNKVKGFKKYLH